MKIFKILCAVLMAFCFFQKAQTQSCVAVPSGLAGWWPGDDNANDLCGTNPGSFIVATYDSGKVGKAFSFDGVDDYVLIGAKPNLVMTEFVSIEAWIFPTGPGSHLIGGGIIVNKEGEYEVARFADGTIQWAFAKTGALEWSWTNTGSKAPLGKWTHVAVVYENATTGATIRTYVNGVLVKTVSWSGDIGDVHSSYNEFRIGGRQKPEESQNFQGLIDEVAIYRRALSAGEVWDIFSADSAGKCKTDADMDGVIDICDNCPGTDPSDPSLFESATGCKKSQVDSDRDGICNPGLTFGTSLCTGVDNCPVTDPSDLSPFESATGCKKSQVDFDLDNICNPGLTFLTSLCSGVDKCPVTGPSDPSRFESATGCRESQVDSDLDCICNPGLTFGTSLFTGVDKCPVTDPSDLSPFESATGCKKSQVD